MYSAVAVLDEERKKKSITRDAVTRGICSQQFLFKGKHDNSDIDMFMFEVLFERIGCCTDDMECILSEEVYNMIEARNTIERNILLGHVKEAEEGIDDYMQHFKEDNRIQRMYCYRSKAYMLLRNGQSSEDYEQARDMIVMAIRETLPGINEDNYKEYLFSTYEIENILTYIKSICLLGKRKKAAELLARVYEYSSEIFIDRSLRARVLPKCAYLMSEYCVDIIQYDRLKFYLEEGLNCLRSEGILYLMLPLVNNIITIYEKHDEHEKAVCWEQYGKLLTELFTEYKCEIPQDSLFYRWKVASYHLDYEIIKGERLGQGLSQEELADDIYSNTASISNIENGKTSPNKSKYMQIMSKLSLERPRIGGFVLTNSYEQLQDICKVRELLSQDNIDEAMDYAKKLSDCGEEAKPLLEAYMTIAELFAKRECEEKYLDNIKTCIEKTYSLSREQYIRKPFMYEYDIMIAYFEALRKIDPDTVAEMLEKVIDTYRRTRVNTIYNYKVFSPLLLQLIRYNRNPRMDYYSELMRLGMLCGKGTFLTGVYWIKGWLPKYTDNPEAKRELLYRSYMFAKLYLSKSAEVKKRYYEELEKLSM